MKNCTLLFCALACGMFSMSQTMQPCVINASGGTYSGQNYSYEWSIGELVLVNEMKDSDSKYVLTNGFLQPFARNENSQKPPAIFRQHEFRVLNNPVKDELRIQLLTGEAGHLMLWMYDDRGNISSYRVVNVSAAGTIESIGMRGFANGTYMLKASFTGDITKEKKSQTYKILKIH
jgi:hypothetical protein